MKGILAVLLLAAAFEAPPKFKATEILSPGLAKGPHYEVAETVETPDYFHQFVVKSEYGEFPADGTDILYTRINEIRALAALEDVSRTQVFLESAGSSVVNVGKSAAGVVTKPGETVKGVGSGISRFAMNTSRKVSRAASDATSSDAKKSEGEPSGAAKAATDAMGASAAARRWAQKLAVDPYTSNSVLRKALLDIGKIDAAGSIAAKVAVPIPAPLSMTATVGDIVWTKDPEELLKENEKKMAEMGVDEKSAKAFFRNANFTPTLATLFVASLHAVGARGLDAYVSAASGATDERDARFFAESAMLLQRLHSESPVSAVMTNSKPLVAVTKDGRGVALLPVDWVSWNADTQKAATTLSDRAKTELGATSLEARLVGRASPEAAREMAALGWTVTQNVPGIVPAPESK